MTNSDAVKRQCRCGKFETYVGAWRPCAECAQKDAEWLAWAEGKSDKEIRARGWREFLESMPETRIYDPFNPQAHTYSRRS